MRKRLLYAEGKYLVAELEVCSFRSQRRVVGVSYKYVQCHSIWWASRKEKTTPSFKPTHDKGAYCIYCMMTVRYSFKFRSKRSDKTTLLQTVGRLLPSHKGDRFRG